MVVPALPCADVTPIGWVDPELVGEVKFGTFTSAGGWHTGGAACAGAGAALISGTHASVRELSME